MSYYRTIKVFAHLYTNSRCYYFCLKGLNLRSPFIIDRCNYLRTFTSLSHIEPEPISPKIDVQTRINTLLEEKSALKNENALLAFHYCGKSYPSLNINQRRALTKQIWNSLIDYSDVSVCHSYIQACIENDDCVNYENFLNNIKFEPNIETYKLLLESICNVGDKHFALKLLEIMKNENHAADIYVFNLLVLAYSISGGYNEAKLILEMMKLARIKSTDVTNWNLLRGAATFKNGSEFINILETHNLKFSLEMFLDVLHRLGVENNWNNIKTFVNKFDRTEVLQYLDKSLVNLCIQLIFQQRPNIALQIYCLLIEPFEENYGMSLLEAMTQSNTSNEIVISSAKQLMIMNLNPRALQSLTEYSLRNKYFEISLGLFQAQDNLKPHYFWPLLIHEYNEKGQIGVFEVIKTMQTLHVPVDADTLYFYIIPNCDLSDPKLLINNLKHLNFKVKEVYTPILASLLIRNDIQNCLDILKHYEVDIDGQRLLKPLVNFYKKSGNFDTTLLIIQKICETNPVATDWTGMFLSQAIRGPKNNSDLEDYLKLLKLIKDVKLLITPAFFDNIMAYLQSRTRDATIMKNLTISLENLVDSTKHEMNYIEHPRNMNVKDLECHLIELNEKQMDTKGILRKLIQEHSRLRNHDRLLELREVYKQSGYTETSGMKASIMNTFITLENLDGALNVYNEIKNDSSKFNLDYFKIIDLANLLVRKGQFDKAMDLLEKESQNIKYDATPTIQRNCLRLLSSCSNAEQVGQLFSYLIDKNICKISNIMLGPLVKIHLNSGNLAEAVKVYKQCVEQHRCTPLQLELLTRIVKEEDSHKYLQEVVALTASIHGTAAARISVLAALAENRHERAITKFLSENGAIPSKLVQARCDRWIVENKLPALITLLKSIERLPTNIMNKSIVQNAILKLHTTNMDCDSALQFYEELREKDMEVTNEFKNNLLALLKRYNYKIPNDLSF